MDRWWAGNVVLDLEFIYRYFSWFLGGGWRGRMALHSHPGAPATHVPRLLADGVGARSECHCHGHRRGGKENGLLHVLFPRERVARRWALCWQLCYPTFFLQCCFSANAFLFGIHLFSYFQIDIFPLEIIDCCSFSSSHFLLAFNSFPWIVMH